MTEKDKNGVEVTPGSIDFGFIDESEPFGARSITIHIETTSVTAVHLVEARLTSALTLRPTTTRYIGSGIIVSRTLR